MEKEPARANEPVALDEVSQTSGLTVTKAVHLALSNCTLMCALGPDLL
jgi:hypothetical protein